MLSISHNMRYMMTNGVIYDLKDDKSYKVNELKESFWLTFLKENIVSSYMNEIKNSSDIKSILREISYKVNNNINESNHFKSIIKSELLIDKEITKENINQIVNDLFEDFNLENTISETKQNINELFGWVKSKGITWFFEGLRKALYSWGGVAVQTFLAFTGVGNVANITVWALMLAYDSLTALSDPENVDVDDVVNIVVDLVGVFGFGPAGRLISKALVPLKTLAVKAGGGLLNMLGVLFKGLMKTNVGSYFGKVAQKIISGLNTYILQPIKQGGVFLEQKFGSNMISRGISRIESFMKRVVDKLRTVIKGNPQVARSAGSLKGLSDDIVKQYRKLYEAAKASGKHIDKNGRYNPRQGTREKWIQEAIKSVKSSAGPSSLKSLNWAKWLYIGGVAGLTFASLFAILKNDKDDIIPDEEVPQNAEEKIKEVGSQEKQEVDKQTYYEGQLCSRVLKGGEKGDDVKDLQQKLNTLYNYGLAVDGIYGTNTKNKVKEFQKTNNIKVDGMFGPESCRTLNGLNQVEKKPSKPQKMEPMTIIKPKEIKAVTKDIPELKNVPEKDIIVVQVPKNTPQSKTDNVVRRGAKKCPAGKEPVLVRRKEKLNRRNDKEDKTIAVYRCRKI